jgi:DNA/RNA endonuclease G (NUC1)
MNDTLAKVEAFTKTLPGTPQYLPVYMDVSVLENSSLTYHQTNILPHEKNTSIDVSVLGNKSLTYHLTNILPQEKNTSIWT